MENWKVCANTCMFVATCVHQTPTNQAQLVYLVCVVFRSVSADIRVRIDGAEDEHGIIKVDKTGKVCEIIARLFIIIITLIGMRTKLQRG